MVAAKHDRDFPTLVDGSNVATNGFDHVLRVPELLRVAEVMDRHVGEIDPRFEVIRLEIPRVLPDRIRPEARARSKGGRSVKGDADNYELSLVPIRRRIGEGVRPQHNRRTAVSYIMLI